LGVGFLYLTQARTAIRSIGTGIVELLKSFD
jgi:hypothetical protein